MGGLRKPTRKERSMIVDETMRLCMKQAAQIAELKRDVQELRHKLDNVPRDNQLAKITEHCLTLGKRELAQRVVTDAMPRKYETVFESYPVWRSRAIDANKIPSFLARLTVCKFLNEELESIYYDRRDEVVKAIDNGDLLPLPDSLMFGFEEEEEEETDEEEYEKYSF